MGRHAFRFWLRLQNGSRQVQRILIGRTTLSTNPLAQPLINSLDGLSNSELNGDSLVIDKSGNVIYQTGNNALATYNNSLGDQPSFSNGTAPDGTRQLVDYQPVEGGPWAIVLTIPASDIQQLALNIALPMFVMILVLAILALVFLHVGLRVITGSLQNLAFEANRIAQGSLDHPLQVEGVDEIGQLRRAFEQMRIRLATRLDELNRLLVVNRAWHRVWRCATWSSRRWMRCRTCEFRASGTAAFDPSQKSGPTSFALCSGIREKFICISG